MIKFISTGFRTFIFDPLAGGNGKIQMDEVAKAILLVITCTAAYREGTSDAQVYPDVFWLSLIAGVAAIAGLKLHYKSPDNHKTEKTEEP
jgi:hypothetical protein